MPRPRAMKSLLAAFLVVLLVPVGRARAAQEPPNVIVLLADDLGAGDLACFGGWIPVPHLAQLAGEGLAAWSEARLAAAAPRMRAELAGEGVDERELDRATAEVCAALVNVLSDPRGRWLFAREHAEARSEWALAGVDGDAIAHVVLDRTFVADGMRWIVDFKTGRHEGADPEAFLDREQERYREQLERYARFVRALDSVPAIEPLFGVLGPSRILSPAYGTRCSTVLVCAPEGAQRFAERAYDTAGNEGETVRFELRAGSR